MVVFDLPYLTFEKATEQSAEQYLPVVLFIML